jgi:hypothetical protein
MEVAKFFSLNFDGVKTKVGSLEIQVTKNTITTTTEMPLQGERWFKGMPLDSSYCNDYFKSEFQNENLSKGVPRSYMLEHHDQLLRVIQDTSLVRGDSTRCKYTISDYSCILQVRKL